MTIARVAALILLGFVTRAGAQTANGNLTSCPGSDPDASIAACTAIIEANGQAGVPLARAFTYRGIAYTQKKQYTRAIADYSQAIRLEPDNDFALVNRGVVYSGIREFDRAMQDFDKVITQNPSAYPAAYYGRGTIYNARGDHERAIVEYSEAIRLQPDFVDALNSRAIAYADNNQFSRAIEDYGQALRFRPAYSFALMNRGNAYASQGLYDRAIEDYDKTIDLDPFPMVFANRGNAYRAKGDYDQAFSDIGAAIRQLAFPAALGFRGDVYLELGQYSRALEDYSESIHIQPSDTDVFHGRGRAEFYFAHWDEAVADFQKSLALDRSNAYAMLWLLLARERSGPGKVGDLAQQASQIHPGKWPAAIIELLLDHLTPELALAAAASDDPDQEKTQHCEAEFYVGEYLLIHEDSAGASKHFHEARRICSGTMVESLAAKMELAHAADDHPQ